MPAPDPKLRLRTLSSRQPTVAGRGPTAARLVVRSSDAGPSTSTRPSEGFTVVPRIALWYIGYVVSYGRRPTIDSIRRLSDAHLIVDSYIPPRAHALDSTIDVLAATMPWVSTQGFGPVEGRAFIWT